MASARSANRRADTSLTATWSTIGRRAASARLATIRSNSRATWLAYVWENLFFACQLCNQRFKRNLFPLADPAKRARSHLDDLTAEEPMLLHPADDEPTVFIGFREEIAFPLDDHPRARTTIEVLGLNREELAEFRLDHLAPFKELKRLLPLLPAESEEAQGIRALLEQAVLPNAQYSSVMRALLADAL